MKKTRENKDTRKPTQPFFKYVPQKIHSRSLMELQPNPRYQQSARQSNLNKQNHHSSLCNHNETDIQTIKSHSLKKFLSLFGTNASNNAIINSMQAVKNNNRCQQKQTGRSTSRQVFTCNIKNMNVNMGASKSKDQTLQNKSFLILKKDKTNTNLKIDKQQQIILTLKKTIDQYKQHEEGLKRQFAELQRENHFLRTDLRTQAEQKQILEKKYALRELQQQRKIEILEKNASKQRCRQHQLIIQSLKKVINEQLRKIIQLQKSKIEREEIQKLEERINLNASIKNEGINKEKLKILQNNQLVTVRRKERTSIKIEEQSNFAESAADESTNPKEIYEDAIEEVTEEEENESLSRVIEDGDSILEQVDKYLALWRNKC